MTPPELAALGAFFLALFAFLVIGKLTSERVEDLDDFLLYGRSLPSRGFTLSFVVTGVSLATVLSFFLDFGRAFGFALLLSPFMYLFGVWLLYRAVPILEHDGFLKGGTTLHSYIGSSLGSAHCRKVTALVSLLGYIGILIIEIHVGVQIFRLFSDATSVQVAVALLLGLVIYIYTWLGGYRAVIDTDRAQLLLIAAAILITLPVLILAAVSSNRLPSIGLFEPFPWKLPVSLAVVMVVGNVPLQIVRMSNWQRIAAVGSPEKVKVGLKNAIVWTFIFWFLFNTMGIFLSRLAPSGSTEFAAVQLLRVIESTSGYLALVAVPVLFVAMVAALISTADTVFAAILAAWVYDIEQYHRLHDESGSARMPEMEERKRLLAVARKRIFPILAVTFTLYLALVWLAKFDFVALLFVFFNQQLVLFPVLMLAFGAKRRAISGAQVKSVERFALSSVIVGWLAVWISTLAGVRTGNPNLVFYAAPIGFLLSTAVIVGSSAARVLFWSGLSRLGARHSG